MQRNKSKKLYSSFHKAEAKLTDPAKSQLLIKNKPDSNSSQLNIENVRRFKDSSIICGFEGNSIESHKSLAKSSTSKNIKYDKNQKWKQMGYGTSRCNNPPVSNRILKEIVNYSQKKKFHFDSKQNQENNGSDENKVKERIAKQKKVCYNYNSCTNEETIQSRNNNLIQDFSPLPNYCLQIEEFVADFSEKEKSFVSSNMVFEEENEEELIKEKQQLLIRLDSYHLALDDYQKQHPIICESWANTIRLEKVINKSKQENEKMKLSLNSLEAQNSKFKTDLFHCSRDYLSAKKIKEYRIRTAKQNILNEASRVHEELRKKLTSKADYEHVVLFNQKVILSGDPHQSFFSVYREMFEGLLAKKFALIIKKELNNLSHYDIRLVQEYLKRIQELETSFAKVEQKQDRKDDELTTEDYFKRVEEKVEKIQQLTIKIEKIQTFMVKEEQKRAQLNKELQNEFKTIQAELVKVSEKVGEDYQRMEGKTFDFQAIIKDKYKELFANFRQAYEGKEEANERVQKIELRLRR